MSKEVENLRQSLLEKKNTCLEELRQINSSLEQLGVIETLTQSMNTVRRKPQRQNRSKIISTDDIDLSLPSYIDPNHKEAILYICRNIMHDREAWRLQDIVHCIMQTPASRGEGLNQVRSRVQKALRHSRDFSRLGRGLYRITGHGEANFSSKSSEQDTPLKIKLLQLTHEQDKINFKDLPELFKQKGWQIQSDQQLLKSAYNVVNSNRTLFKRLSRSQFTNS